MLLLNADEDEDYYFIAMRFQCCFEKPTSRNLKTVKNFGTNFNGLDYSLNAFLVRSFSR